MMSVGMRSSSSDRFAVMQLASCSAPATLTQGLDPGEVMVAGNSLKRQTFYSQLLDASEEAGADIDQLGDEYFLHAGKKIRRLTTEQVKALEKNFEAENKLEPERKVHLARELGLQPRQVAVWFQNRRARWKTKQLEKDYNILKTEYDALKLSYEAVLQEKEKLQTQLFRLNENVKISDGSDSQPPTELTRAIYVESTGMHMPNEIMSDNSTQSNLFSCKPLQDLRISAREDIGCSSSESDDSEVLDVESPLPLELTNLVSSPTDPSSLISTAGGKVENEKLMCTLNHITQRSVVKLEDGSYNPEESSTYLFNLEDHVTSHSWWDQWP